MRHRYRVSETDRGLFCDFTTFLALQNAAPTRSASSYSSHLPKWTQVPAKYVSVRTPRIVTRKEPRADLPQLAPRGLLHRTSKCRATNSSTTTGTLNPGRPTLPASSTFAAKAASLFPLYLAPSTFLRRPRTSNSCSLHGRVSVALATFIIGRFSLLPQLPSVPSPTRWRPNRIPYSTTQDHQTCQSYPFFGPLLAGSLDSKACPPYVTRLAGGAASTARSPNTHDNACISPCTLSLINHVGFFGLSHSFNLPDSPALKRTCPPWPTSTRSFRQSLTNWSRSWR